MFNNSTERPVFADRNDLNMQELPFPDWPSQLQANNDPVFADRNDLNMQELPFPDWPSQLQANNDPVFADRNDLNMQELPFPAWPSQLQANNDPVFADRNDLNMQELPFPAWPSQLQANNDPVFADRNDLNMQELPFPDWPCQLQANNDPVFYERNDLNMLYLPFPDWPSQLLTSPETSQNDNEILNRWLDGFKLKSIINDVEMAEEVEEIAEETMVTEEQINQILALNESKENQPIHKNTFKRGLSDTNQESLHKKLKDPISSSQIKSVNGLEIENETNLIPFKQENQTNQIGYSEEFIQLKNSNDVLLVGSFKEIIETYKLQVVKVPRVGHCFINSIIEYFKIFHQVALTLEQIEKHFEELNDNPGFLTTYGALVMATLPKNHAQLYENDIIKIMLSDMRGYFRLKEFSESIYLDLIIEYASKVFSIDIIILQCNKEVDNATDTSDYTIVRRLFNHPNHMNEFITLSKSSKENNSHYQSLIPASFDMFRFNRANIVSNIEHNIDANNEVQNILDSFDDHEMSSTDSLSQSGDESSTVTSYSSSDSSSSTTNCENEKVKYSRDEADQLKFDAPKSSTSQRPTGYFDVSQQSEIETNHELDNAFILSTKSYDESLEEINT
jgi:hypothetical protein